MARNNSVAGSGAKLQRISPRERARLAAVEALALREQQVTAREIAVALREQTAAQQETARLATAQIKARADQQLREANANLVSNNMRSQEIVEAAEHAAAQMLFKAERDFLTGLPNRALLHDRLEQSLAFAQRHRKGIAVMYLDIDHFKQINDSLGHTVGDKLLQSVAQRLLGCLRHSDTVSRQGGDEFVILLDDIGCPADVTVTAEKLIRGMSPPHFIDGHLLNVSISIGISIFPDDGANIEVLLSHADTAMYQAKRSGRNRHQRYLADDGAMLAAP